MDSKFRNVSEMNHIDVIVELREEFKEKLKEYQDMMSDGKIDSNELERIIVSMEETKEKAIQTKESCSPSELNKIQGINDIIDLINSSQEEMKKFKDKEIEEINTEAAQLGI